MSDLAADTRQRRRLLAAAPRLVSFDAHDYARLNADLADREPFAHFARFGAWEGRAAASPERLTARLAVATALARRPGRLGAEEAARAWRAAATLQPWLRLPRSPSAGARAAAEACAALLEGVGARPRLVAGLQGAADGEAELLFDAPHLFAGARPQGAEADRLARAAVWVEAAPGEPAFDAALPYALTARAAVCREAQAYAAFAHAGSPAVWLGAPPRDPARAEAPPDHPLIAGLSRAVRAARPGLPWRERPIALAALEDATDARSQAWSRMAEAMAPVALVLRRPAGPQAHLPHEAELRRWIYARSQVVLHLHADVPRAVDARAAAEAADARAVLLAEPSPAHVLLRGGEHYAEASARRMAARLAELAADPRGSARTAEALAAALAVAFEPETLGLQLALALAGPERAA